MINYADWKERLINVILFAEQIIDFQSNIMSNVAQKSPNPISIWNRSKTAVWKVASTAVMHHKNGFLQFWPHSLSGENSPDTPFYFDESLWKNMMKVIKKFCQKFQKYFRNNGRKKLSKVIIYIFMNYQHFPHFQI